MRKQREIYTSPLDALVAVSKQLSLYNNRRGMDSETFFDRYQNSLIGDDAEPVEWANAYQHTLRCTNSLRASCVLPHDSLERYFAEVEAAVVQLPAYAESYVEEILTAGRANLRIRLRFENGVLKTLGYRYHSQRADGELMFRYDNTPHFPELPSYPHHKHLRDTVVAASKLLYLALRNIVKDWMMPPRTGKEAADQFAIMLGERFTAALN